MTENADTKSTFKGRMLRLQTLLNYIKDKKELTVQDVYRYMMTKYFLARNTVDAYIQDLIAMGQIKLTSKEKLVTTLSPDKQIITYTGGEEHA